MGWELCATCFSSYNASWLLCSDSLLFCHENTEANPWQQVVMVIKHCILNPDEADDQKELTAGPGIPLSPWGPGFPEFPCAPTGPVFPTKPSIPGDPWGTEKTSGCVVMWLTLTVGNKWLVINVDHFQQFYFRVASVYVTAYLCSFHACLALLSWFPQVALNMSNTQLESCQNH